MVFGLRMVVKKLPLGFVDVKMMIILALIGVIYYQNTTTIPTLNESSKLELVTWKQEEIRLLEMLTNR